MLIILILAMTLIQIIHRTNLLDITANEDGVTFTLKNGSQLNYSPPGEPLQFINAPTGVIFDSASSQ